MVVWDGIDLSLLLPYHALEFTRGRWTSFKNLICICLRDAQVILQLFLENMNYSICVAVHGTGKVESDL